MLLDKQDRLNEIVENLRIKGLRLTPQRLAILKILVSTNSHPTVEEVFSFVKQDFPMTSLATVYKTIALLKDIEEVVELDFGNEPNRYDGTNKKPHPHLICINCKKIIDPDLELWNQIPEIINKTTGYKVTNYRMDVFGVCPNCQQKLLKV